jgi:hypothetical protein
VFRVNLTDNPTWLVLHTKFSLEGLLCDFVCLSPFRSALLLDLLFSNESVLRISTLFHASIDSAIPTKIYFFIEECIPQSERRRVQG